MKSEAYAPKLALGLLKANVMPMPIRKRNIRVKAPETEGFLRNWGRCQRRHFLSQLGILSRHFAVGIPKASCLIPILI